MDGPRVLGLGYYGDLLLLLKGLERWHTVVGTLKPITHAPMSHKLRFMHPNIQLWRAKFNMSPDMYALRTRDIHQQLQAWEGQYDVILQYFAFFTPGLYPEQQRYVVVTDNTIEISVRLHPAWAPFRGRIRQEQRQWEERIYRNAAFVFPFSDFVGTSLIEDYGCDPQRVVTVNPGTRFIKPSIAGKCYDRQIALFIGYDFERKGGRELLQAWKIVRRQLPDAQLWIVGNRLQRVLSQPGVRWFGRIKQKEVLQHMLHEATLLTLPSKFEPWGMVLTEAMGSGLPCITTNHGAMPEVIQHGETGLLVEPGQVEPLAEALIDLLGHPERAEAMGKKAYRHVLYHRTWYHAAARMKPYLEKAARGEV